VSAPSQAAQVTALAALSGAAPDPSLPAAVAVVAQIIAAREQGATWSQVGMAVNGDPDPRLAKRYARNLARRAQRAVIAAGILAEEADDA
jgi:hypothetical protein